MTAVLVAFLIAFVQMGPNGAICHELMAAKSDQACLVMTGELTASQCPLSHCVTCCRLATQQTPFSGPKSADKALLNPAKVALALNSVVIEGFSPTPLLWPRAAKEPSEFGVDVYLLNTSFLI